MLIILLNIIPVFNDDRFGLFLHFIYSNSSCYIFVWCSSFLAYQYYRRLVDWLSVQIFFGFLYIGLFFAINYSCLTFFFLNFSYFWLLWSVCERHDLLSTLYVLRIFQRSFFSCRSNIIILICRFPLVSFCLAVPNGSHILSWMCLNGLILIFYLSSVERQVHLRTISRFESEKTIKVWYEGRLYSSRGSLNFYSNPQPIKVHSTSFCLCY